MGKDEIIKVNWGEKDDNYFRKLGEIVFEKVCQFISENNTIFFNFILLIKSYILNFKYKLIMF